MNDSERRHRSIQAFAQLWGVPVTSFVTTLLLGPPVGGILVALLAPLFPDFGTGVGGYFSAFGSKDWLLTGLTLLFLAVPFSYLFGGLQAVIAGFAFAIYAKESGRPPLWFALSIAVLISIIGIGLGFVHSRSHVPTVIIHAVPVLVCWSVVRLFWEGEVE